MSSQVPVPSREPQPESGSRYAIASVVALLVYLTLLSFGRVYCSVGELIIRYLEKLDLGGMAYHPAAPIATGGVVLLGIAVALVGIVRAGTRWKRILWTLVAAEITVLVASVIVARLAYSTCVGTILIR